MKQCIRSLITLVALTLTLTTPALATVVMLTMDGYFGERTTLNGVDQKGKKFNLVAKSDTYITANDNNISYFIADNITLQVTIAGTTHNYDNSVGVDKLIIALVYYPDVLGNSYAVGITYPISPGYFTPLFATSDIAMNSSAPNFGKIFYNQDNNNGGNDYNLNIPLTNNGPLIINTLFLIPDPSSPGDSTTDLKVQFNGPSTVPEPSTYLLLTLSLGVVGFARKKMGQREK